MSKETLQIVRNFSWHTFQYLLEFQTNLCFFPKLLCQTEFECNRRRSDLVTFELSTTLKCPIFSLSSVFFGLAGLWTRPTVTHQFALLFFLFKKFRDFALAQEIKRWKWIIQCTLACSLIQQRHEFAYHGSNHYYQFKMLISRLVPLYTELD